MNIYDKLVLKYGSERKAAKALNLTHIQFRVKYRKLAKLCISCKSKKLSKNKIKCKSCIAKNNLASKNSISKNKDRRKEVLKNYRENNKENIKKHFKNYRKKNKNKINRRAAKRRFNLRKAMPNWLTEKQLKKIDKMYKLAQTKSIKTGLKYDVDHIIPLQHDLICGLHVPWNLRVIEHNKNVKKSNKFKPFIKYKK